MDAIERVKKLEDDLYMARLAIVSLVPDRYSKLLRTYRGCETKQSSYSWLDDVADQIIDGLEPLAKEDGSYFAPRAYCPLCGNGSSSPYDKGFSLSEGLKRHLTGWGNTQRCVVTEAASAIARDYFHRKFSASEEAERVEEQAKRAQRMRIETLFRTGPGCEPELVSDVGYGAQGRDAVDMDWAESRLSELGFTKSEDDRVVQYYLDINNHGVFADPRRQSEILFRVYKKPFPKKIQRARTPLFTYFSIRDAWKNDLLGKFDARLKKAI